MLAQCIEQATVNSKNQRLKESLLVLLQRMQTIYGAAMRDAVSALSMCTTLAVCLNDPQSSMRQVAVTTLASLYPTYGEELVVRLCIILR